MVSRGVALCLPAALCAVLTVSVVLPLSAETRAGTAPPLSDGAPKSPGEAKICAITRDAGLSSYEGERDGNNGRGTTLKLKGQQEFVLFDSDTISLAGKIVEKAVLHVRSADPRRAPLGRVSVSSVASPWVEGTATGYRKQEGSSSFNQAETGGGSWAYEGGSVMDVTLGHGNTIWEFADCTMPDPAGWQSCAVSPDVVAARVSGLSHGFVLYDDIGSTWSLRGGRFSYEYFPNRTLYGRESGISAPWLEVQAGKEDRQPPETIGAVGVSTAELPPGEAVVSWTTPADRGAGRTLGFVVSYRREGGERREVPRHLVPMARDPGRDVRMHLRDLSLRAGETIGLSIRPVDSAGNIGNARDTKVTLSGVRPVVAHASPGMRPFPQSSALPAVGGVRVSVLDLLDTLDPVSGELIPPRPPGYRGGNHLFSAEKRRVRLQAARNETVYFQLSLEGRADGIDVRYEYAGSGGLSTKIHEFAYVELAGKAGRGSRFLPDPLVPFVGPISIPSGSGQVAVSSQRHHALVLEVHVPHRESPGEKRGTVTVSAGGESLVLNVDLTVWNFTLPNKLSFVPEMNTYGGGACRGYGHYRLAHEHRTCFNSLPYGWNGNPSCAPAWDGRRFNWGDWDAKAGPLFDGSAFRDLPRGGEPVDVFYLPFSENWPVPLGGDYTPSYWAEEALSPNYAGELGTAFREFARHVAAKGWLETDFQFFLNNKVYFRADYPGSSAPWIFDEPVGTQDFWALRWYGLLWKRAVAGAPPGPRLRYRTDVSYGEFGRDLLWGLTDVEYIGGNTPQKVRMKEEERLAQGTALFAEYGTANEIGSSNVQPAAWCLAAWTRGASAVLPWQTLGGERCWRTADRNSLFYPGGDDPRPSVRLKAFTVGQQIVEYLTLFALEHHLPRYVLSGWLHGVIDLRGAVVKGSQSDAGTFRADGASAEALWEARLRLGAALSAAAPPYRRELPRGEIPPWDERNVTNRAPLSAGQSASNLRPEVDRW